MTVCVIPKKPQEGAAVLSKMVILSLSMQDSLCRWCLLRISINLSCSSIHTLISFLPASNPFIWIELQIQNFRTENHEEEIQVLRTIIEEKKLNVNADLTIKYTPVEAIEKHKYIDLEHSDQKNVSSPSKLAAEATFRFTYSKEDIYRLLSSYSAKKVRSNFSIENIMEYFEN